VGRLIILFALLFVIAQDLVRTRQYVTKFIEMRSHLQGCALKLQTVKSHHAMGEAMSSTAKAMHKMNKAVDVKALTKMMAEFEKENAKTEIMQEIMGDTLDDALADENTEEEEDAVVNQVLDEIGVSFGAELPEASLGAPAVQESAGPGKVAVAAAEDPALTELEARLNNLKR
jgi:charged multivesicular body protein 2A